MLIGGNLSKLEALRFFGKGISRAIFQLTGFIFFPVQQLNVRQKYGITLEQFNNNTPIIILSKPFDF